MADLDRVQRWRARIPWNNAQIEIAIRDEAKTQPNAHMRDRYLARADYLAKTGHFTSTTLGTVLQRLITTCAVCGDVALFRLGYMGRCRTHRLVGQAAAQARFEQRWAAYGVREDDYDRGLRKTEAARRYGSRHRGRHGVERVR